MQSFLNNFQAAQKAVSDAGVAAAQTARMSAIEAYEKATRLKLNVRIKAPIILIPVDSNSMDALSLDLGMLELSNQISSIPVQGHTTDKAIVDEIKLQLKDMKITKVVILGDGNQQLSSENMHYMDGMFHLGHTFFTCLTGSHSLAQLWTLRWAFGIQPI